MGSVGSKRRSLGQILEKSCLHSGSHILGPFFIKLTQDDNHDDISIDCDHGWAGVKSRSLGQILENLVHTLEATFSTQS